MLPVVYGENMFDDLFNNGFFGSHNPLFGKNARNLMKTDIRETDDAKAYRLAVELPGFKKDEISLDLEIDIVGVGIILPVARFRRLDAVEQVVAGCLVGMPQRISCMREGVCEGVHRGIQSQAVENLHEGGIHVYVVI